MLKQLVRHKEVRKEVILGECIYFRQVCVKMTVGIKMKCPKGSSSKEVRRGNTALASSCWGGVGFQTLKRVGGIAP